VRGCADNLETISSNRRALKHFLMAARSRNRMAACVKRLQTLFTAPIPQLVAADRRNTRAFCCPRRNFVGPGGFTLLTASEPIIPLCH